MLRESAATKFRNWSIRAAIVSACESLDQQMIQNAFKVIPQFCIAHSSCAYFNNKSLRNIFKMAAILLRKNKSKRARNGRFSELKRVSKKKNGV